MIYLFIYLYILYVFYINIQKHVTKKAKGNIFIYYNINILFIYRAKRQDLFKLDTRFIYTQVVRDRFYT